METGSGEKKEMKYLKHGSATMCGSFHTLHVTLALELHTSWGRVAKSVQIRMRKAGGGAQSARRAHSFLPISTHDIRLV